MVHTLTHAHTHTHTLSHTHILSLYLSLSISLSLPLSLSLYLPLSLSLIHTHYLSISLCLSISLSLSRPPTPRHTHISHIPALVLLRILLLHERQHNILLLADGVDDVTELDQLIVAIDVALLPRNLQHIVIKVAGWRGPT